MIELPARSGSKSTDAAGLLEEGEDYEEVKTSEPAPASPPLSRIVAPWLPDAPQRCGGNAVKTRIRLAKFLVLSWVLIVCGYAFMDFLQTYFC